MSEEYQRIAVRLKHQVSRWEWALDGPESKLALDLAGRVELKC